MTKHQAHANVLVIDDEQGVRSICSAVLGKAGFQVFEAGSGEAGLQLLKNNAIDVVLLDHHLPGISGMDLLKDLRNDFPNLEIIIITAFGSFETVVQAMKDGAYDFLSKPFKDNALISMVVARAVERKRLVERARSLESQIADSFGSMVGASPRIKAVYKMIQDLCSSDCTVLITGESGTGKELVARSLHSQSARKDKVFLAVNCAALTESLLESELFGHVKGAFTGATGAKRGLFEAADGGTIFLDEIGDMSPATQVKLLRTLQEGEVRPVGGTQTLKVDVRVIAATNRVLEEQVQKGEFRQDLYYRLNVINIHLPPLRERREDIPMLASHFVQQYAQRYKKSIKSIAPEALEALEKCNWAGNVRELQHAVERAVVMTKRDVLGLEGLPTSVVPIAGMRNIHAEESGVLQTYKDAKHEVVANFTKNYVRNLLQRTGGNLAKAAELAGMERSNFRRLIDKYSSEEKNDSKPGSAEMRWSS